jgi:hypothetical protein
VGRIQTCKPEDCRASVEDKFSADRMVDAYERLLLEVVTSG